MPDELKTPISVGASTAEWLEWDGWYRETANKFVANRDRAMERSFAEIHRHVLDGWLPSQPFITKDKLVTAFGSCFAYHVEEYLRLEGYTTSTGLYGAGSTSNYWSHSLLIKCAEGFVNTWSIRYQLEWLFTGSEPEIEIWAKKDGRVRRYLDDNLAAGRKLLDDTAVFIITLGLSEVWYRKDNSKVLWAGVPQSQYDPELFAFRQTTTVENLANLQRTVDLIREYRGDVPIVFTLSPVPLQATFRPVSCVSANSVSKAVLRVAVDELMRANEHDKKLHYFPSYEIVTGYLRDPFFQDDQSHPSYETVSAIMEAFTKSYCVREP